MTVDAVLPKRTKSYLPFWRDAYPTLLILPSIIVMLLVMLYPLLTVSALSLTSPKVGFDNYVWAFTNPVNAQVIARTFYISAEATLVCVVLAYPYALLMSLVGPRVRILMILAVLVPFWVSSVVRTLAWVILLQDNGLVNSALVAIGASPMRLIRTPSGVLIGMSQVLMPFMVMPLYSVMRGIDPRLVLAAKSLGAHPAKAFLQVYFPLSLPGVYSGATLVFILSLGFFITPELLGGTKGTMIAGLIALQVNNLLEWGKGAALGVVLLLGTLILLALASLFTNKGIVHGAR